MSENEGRRSGGTGQHRNLGIGKGLHGHQIAVQQPRRQARDTAIRDCGTDPAVRREQPRSRGWQLRKCTFDDDQVVAAAGLGKRIRTIGNEADRLENGSGITAPLADDEGGFAAYGCETGQQPPKFGRRKIRAFHVLAHPDNRILRVKEDETLLDACLREGLAMPFDCRNGGCGVCKCTILHGEVEVGPHQESALGADEQAAGRVLAGVAKPRDHVAVR